MLLRIPEPSLVLMVGVAGSGKSTLAARLFAPEEILSSDVLRGAISGDEADLSVSRVAFRVLYRQLEQRLAAGSLTVVDATNVRREHRRPLIERAAAAGVPAAAIVLDLPLDVVLARNAARRRVVPRDAIEGQQRWLRRTIDLDQLPAERFDPVHVIADPAGALSLEVERTRAG